MAKRNKDFFKNKSKALIRFEMSRLLHEDIWSFHCGIEEWVYCLCCGKRRIHREKKTSRRDWIRGHVIPAGGGTMGPDMYENVRPICLDCNEEDKRHPSNYHYMAFLGRITREEADMGVARIWAVYDYQRRHPTMISCLATTESTGRQCGNQRKPRSHFCKVHNRDGDYQINSYLEELIKMYINYHLKLLQRLKNENIDPELIQFENQMVKSLQHQLAEIWN